MKPKTLPPLVGRAQQLDAVLDAITAARDGRGRVVLIHGEAGIGKTRLCHEVRVRLGRYAMQLITGRAGPGDAGMSYSALADSLRATRRSGAAFWASAGGRSETLAAVVPELAHRGSVASTLVDRPVVYEALLDVVEEAAVDRATAWFLEDLHWADPATWAFVEYAARRVGDMSLVLVATARDEDLPLDTHARLLELSRDPDVLALALERLDDADARALAGALAPELPAPAVDRVARRSAGNPLLVEELLALGGDLSAGIPDIVRAAARERTARLDADERAVLEAAAALGPRFDVDQLLKTAPIDPSRAREQLSGGGLVVAADDPGGDVLAFWHPLVWEAVYNDIPLPRRRQLHARIATTLEAQDPQLQPESLARHHELADDADAALETLLVARKAVGGNVGRAASLARTALDLARRHPALHERVDELARLAVNDLFLAGRWTELEPLVRELWPTRHAMPAEARAWLANAAVMDLLFLGEVARARATADDEVAYVEAAGDSSSAGLLFAQAAFLAYFSGDFAVARDRSERAVTVARSSGDAEASARAQLVRVLARRRLDRSRTRSVADLRDNAAFARSAGLGVREANALFVMAYMTLRGDDFAAAEVVGTAAGTWYAPLAQVLHGLLHVLEGRPDHAEALLARAGAEVRHGIPTLGFAVDVAEAHLFLHRGEMDHARGMLDRSPVAPEAMLIPMLRSGHAGARGWLAWEEQRFGDAAAAFAESSTSCFSGGGYDILDAGPLMLPLQADALVRLDRAAEAHQAIERCAAADAEPDRFTVAAVAAARFRVTPSEDAADAADRAAAAGPWPWLAALVGCWRGELLGDAEAVARARDQFEAVEALRGVERADAVLDSLGRRGARRAGASPQQLSPRELEVAELVTEGLTNSAIAARLFVSRATVSSHVTHILTKLGFTSRAQIAAWTAGRRTPPG
ncbi:MAG TPA: AAA family ATPase [Acidimicrobiales bacterium]|nr:AAA family ATPase [Acidimicrobiales bacterium]